MDEKETINRVVEDGLIIYRDYCDRAKKDESFSVLSYQAKYEYYMKKYIDYARSYPIIVRYIASFGMYHPKAVRLYLKKCFSTPMNDDEEFCNRQADYVKYLYMYCNPHMSRTKLNEIWAHTKKSMMNEMEINRKEKKIVRDRRKKNEGVNNTTRRDNAKKRVLEWLSVNKIPKQDDAT